MYGRSTGEIGGFPDLHIVAVFQGILYINIKVILLSGSPSMWCNALSNIYI
jgi:hypothetical protein